LASTLSGPRLPHAGVGHNAFRTAGADARRTSRSTRQPAVEEIALIAGIFIVVPFVSTPALPLGGGADGRVLAAPQVVAAP
jgi:hypothetical protein